jgi:S1-C subfamily serine protease
VSLYRPLQWVLEGSATIAMEHLLSGFSDELAGLAERAGASVVQVRSRHARPATGFVFAPERVLLAAHTLDNRNGLTVRTQDEVASQADLAGVDPSTNLAVLRVPGLVAPALTPAGPARPGAFGLLLGRTWSGALAVSAGIVSVVGGPLRTGRGPAIEQVIRADVRVHPLGAGGPLVDAGGAVLGVATGASMRGLPLFIPGAIAWTLAGALAEQGRIKRGYLGISAQPVRMPDAQRDGAQETGLLVVGLAPGSPASAALLVGDIVVGFDGAAVRHHDDLLGLLTGERVGHSLAVDLVRGGKRHTVQVEVAAQQ